MLEAFLVGIPTKIAPSTKDWQNPRHPTTIVKRVYLGSYDASETGGRNFRRPKPNAIIGDGALKQNPD